MKGRKTMIGLTFINPQYIQEAEFETVSGNSESGKPKTGHLKILLIAAMVSTMLLLTGAGLYTRWSNTAQARYQPSEQIKDQAEKSGLSTVVSETQTAENTGEVLSVTDQGITISLVQTIVDNYRAELTFRIQGFELPRDGIPRCGRWSPWMGLTRAFSAPAAAASLTERPIMPRENGSIQTERRCRRMRTAVLFSAMRTVPEAWNLPSISPSTKPMADISERKLRYPSHMLVFNLSKRQDPMNGW